METSHHKRKLAAILEADVVGYSRLMSEHEESTLNALQKNLEIFKKYIPEYDGCVFGFEGDSVIAEFQSSVQAVRCAIDIQERITKLNADFPEDERMQFRIGINVGDVIVQSNGVKGDGVNIATRLEGLADPGGVCVSADVYRQVCNKLDLNFENLGRHKLKNISEPLEVYRAMIPSSGVGAAQRSYHKSKISRLSTIIVGFSIVAVAVAAWFQVQPDTKSTSAQVSHEKEKTNPSIVVIPFTNLSGDPNQEYFIDGITEDIITDLSSLSNLTVLARNTSFVYKSENVQPQVVGKELGVNYVLDGSVRKLGDRIRITAQLVSVQDGSNIWAERYDRRLKDVFELQDEVTNRIVSALSINLTHDEQRQLANLATNNLEAYEQFLIGQQHFRTRTKEGNELARQAYYQAIKLDPNYARAYGALAVVYIHNLRNKWTKISDNDGQRAFILAQKAVSLNELSPQAYWSLGYIYLYRKDYDEAISAAEKSIVLAPNYADGYGLLAFIHNWQGNAEQALRYIKKAMMLNPHYTFEYPWNMGLSYYTLGKYSEAIEAFTNALERNEYALHPRLYLAASYVRLKQQEDAEWEIGQATILHPEITIDKLSERFPYKDPEMLNSFMEDLRKAGLPE